MRRLSSGDELDFRAYDLVKKALEEVSEVSGDPAPSLVVTGAEAPDARFRTKQKRVAHAAPNL